MSKPNQKKKSNVKGKQVKRTKNPPKPQPIQKKQVKPKTTVVQAPYAKIQGGVGHLTINDSGRTTARKYEHPIVNRSSFRDVKDFLDPMDVKKFDKFVQMDPRGYDSVGSVKNVFMDNTLDQIPYIVPTTGEVLSGPIYGVVCEALTRGYIPNAANESYPYFAYIYMTNMLISAANNATPKEMTIPRWLAHLVQALVQTRVKSRAGHVSYKFTVPAIWDDNYIINMGPVLFARAANLGIKSLTPTWPGSYWYVTGAPSPYSEGEGELAAQEIWQFLKSCYEDNDKHTMVSIGQANFMTSDASAFAVNISSPGGGFRNTGAPRVELTLEVPVFRPMFSLLRTQTSNDVVPTRAANFPRSYGGDSVWLGGQLLRRPDPLYQSKTPPIFKFIDFYEIVDVFALYVRYACEAKMLDSETEAVMEAFGGSSSVYYAENVQCPLTRQELAIMLRSVLMSLFADTQPYVQGLFPRVPGSLSAIDFVAFVSGVGTHPVLGASSMLMPLLLKNNLLALTERISFPGFIEGTSVNNMTQYTPVLGAYNGISDLGTLTFEGLKNGTGTVDYEPFVVNPLELPIDMVDGKYSGGYAQINDPSGVNKLILAWNDWSTRMADFFWSTTPFSVDAGNPALWSLGFTNNWTFAPVLEEEKKVKEKVCFVPEHRGIEKEEEPKKTKTFEEIRDTRWTSVGDTPPGSNIYNLRDVIAVTTSTKPFKSAWLYNQYFIKPINPLPNIFTPVVPRQSTDYTRISCLNQEFFSLVTSTGTAGPTISLAENMRTKHMQLAKLCIKSKYAEKGDFQEVMESWEKNGQAGILSSIAAGLIGSIFPDAKPIVESIAGVIPF